MRQGAAVRIATCAKTSEIRVRRLFLACLLVCLGAAAGAGPLRQPDYHNRPFDPDCCLVISHAAGSFAGRTYSNSREALDANFSIGRRVFEIDFSLTSDGVLALVHDWTNWGKHRKPGEGVSEWPDEAGFLSKRLPGGLSPMTMPDLLTWLDAHPEALVVTDTKDDFSDFTEAFFAYPVDPSRFVFQVYGFEDLDNLGTHTGAAMTILTTYKLKIETEDLVAGLKGVDVDGLTIPLPRALKHLAALRQALPDLPIYVHGRPQQINAVQLHFHLQELGASGFYLD